MTQAANVAMALADKDRITLASTGTSVCMLRFRSDAQWFSSAACCIDIPFPCLQLPLLTSHYRIWLALLDES